MVKLKDHLPKLAKQKIMVLGDFMLDTYTIGKASRISPEAPVVVVRVIREEHRPGGAGNVVLNLISLGAEVVAVGRIGLDNAGSKMLCALSEEGVNVAGIVTQKCFTTPIKNRVLAENQQIVRVDHEQITTVPTDVEDEIISKFASLLDDVKIIAISDYGKGFLTDRMLEELIKLAGQLGIPIISDPKGSNFTKYNGSTVLKPNLGEAYAAANLFSDAPLELAAQRIFKTVIVDVLMITRSEAGISLFYRDGDRKDFPVKMREVKDVTGAGDTVLATLACAMANNLPIDIAVQLSNVTAGMAIERFGCARITLAELTERLTHDAL